jgi:hypothetical protein
MGNFLVKANQKNAGQESVRGEDDIARGVIEG